MKGGIVSLRIMIRCPGYVMRWQWRLAGALLLL